MEHLRSDDHVKDEMLHFYVSIIFPNKKELPRK